MNHQDTDNRIRPGLLLLVACVLAAILIPLGISAIHKSKPSSAGATTTAESSATVKPSAAHETAAPAAAVEPAAAMNPAAPVLSTALEEPWGIQVSSIRLTKADAAVDLRYKVVAPEKAALLAADKTTAYLIDQASGAKIQMLASPQEGAWPTNTRARTAARMMHQAGEFPPPANRLAAGKTYSLLLPNPGGMVKSGSKVALVVGNCRTDALTVE